MAERYLDLALVDRREVLDVAASASGRPAYLLEEDVWVVWALEALFGDPFGTPLVFKGGTSLSKAYGAIRRFSEDVDLAYDIRALVPELVGNQPNALPPSRSQEQKWTKAVREALGTWTHDVAMPVLLRALRDVEPDGDVEVKGCDVFIRYVTLNEGTAYGRSEVKLEFGGRATGEPSAPMPVHCDAAEHVHGVEFPTAEPRVLQAERTFWEKATAAHVFCTQQRVRGEGFARHWHDLVRLNDAGVAASALAAARSRRTLQRTRPCSSGRRTRRETGWTTRRRWLAVCAWFRLETRCWRWRATMRGWLKTGGCWTTRSRLTH